MHPLPAADRLLAQLRDRRIVQDDCVLLKKMSGTTAGSVWIIALHGEPLYVLKIDAPEEVQPVAAFLAAYRDLPLLPQVRFADPEHRYYVYDFVPGETYAGRGPKAEWLAELAERMIARYRPASPEQGWGWVTEVAPTWREFMERRLRESKQTIGDVLPEDDYVRLIRQAERFRCFEEPDEVCLLHGDCGAHNFLFRDRALQGVIDPAPMIGPPLYDLLFAFCSSPDDLTEDVLLGAVRKLARTGTSLTAEPQKLIAETCLQLYCRIATCLRHHSGDLPAYLEAWPYWKERLEA